MACRLFDVGASKETGADLMHLYNEIKCFPMWEAGDIAKKVDSAMQNRQNPIGIVSTSEGFTPLEIDESKHPR